MTISTNTTPDLSVLKRPSGGFAMLAVDQREALRNMLGHARGGAVITDQDMVDFKVAAAKALTPYASAVLIDHQFALDEAIRQHVVASSCALIASGDLFIPAHEELVGEVDIDPDITPEQAKSLGAVAQKLLVIWRTDQPAQGRIDLVKRFVAGCHEAGVLAIIEPVCKKPVGPAVEWTWEDDVLTAARELGNLGADLYKGEVPLHGKGDAEAITTICADMNDAIDSEWVVLSSGVAEEDFPRAVRLAMSAGASGFLAGRAVWASCLDATDVEESLRTDAVRRLQDYAAIVDEGMRSRS
jgi:sulfofructosephosphate aldolase